MFVEALTYDVCVGKDTKAAAAPEESDTDAEESEAAEEAGPSSKDLAKDTPVGESHGCWCVRSSDLVLLRQCFYCWAMWLGMSLASYGKIQYRLRTLLLATAFGNAAYFMRIISCIPPEVHPAFGISCYVSDCDAAGHGFRPQW